MPPACSRQDELPTLPKCEWDKGYSSEVVLAMDSANASLATTEQLLSGALHALKIEEERFLDKRKEILSNPDGTPLTSVTWNPTKDSAQLKATMGINVQLLGSNKNKRGSHTNSVTLAVLGKRGESRYVAFAGNPLCERWATNNEQMNTMLKNTIRWLATGKTGKDPNKPITLRFAHLADTYWFPHEEYSRKWLEKNMPEVKYNGKPGQCDPNSDHPCCSPNGWCGKTTNHCKCGRCTDYRNLATGM